MENILGRGEYEFDAGFSEFNDRKYAIVKEEKCKISNVDFFDKPYSNIKKEDHPDIFSNIQNFSVVQKESSSNCKAFSENDLKYLLSKDLAENDPKKHAKSKKETEEEEREKMQVLVSNFTEEQLDRYEMFRRAAFPKAAIKRIMQVITGNSVSQNVVIAMSGIAKVFVGEIVEEALDIMEAQNDTGPLQPKHLREASRRLRLKGKVPSLRDKKPNYRF